MLQDPRISARMTSDVPHSRSFFFRLCFWAGGPLALCCFFLFAQSVASPLPPQHPPPSENKTKPTPQSVLPVRSSDIIAGLPDGEMKRKFVVGCTPCHQIAPPFAMRYDKLGWDTVIKRMHQIDDDLELRLIPFHKGELTAWLLNHVKIPAHGAPPPLPEAKAAWKEYPIGVHKGFYHDVTILGGRAWIVDYFGNILYGVDLKTGAKQAFPVPISAPKGKPAGAHSMDISRDGEIWITFTKTQQVARFDTKTNTFRVYSGFQKGANVQYFALDVDRYVYKDPKGRVWVNHFSKEILSRLDPKTGKIRVFQTPRTQRLPEEGVHLYAVVADSKGRLWYTETHGNRLGMLDPTTGKAEEWELFVSWSGPKRLAIDPQDRLWIPHLGTGGITVYDTRQRKIIKQLSLPIPGDYPYAIRRNRYTGDLWVTGTGSDSLYRLNPANYQFTLYRLPRKGAYTRTVDFTKDGYIWTCYGSFPNYHTIMPYQSGVIVRLSPQ